jgi:hypothetical protein
MEKQRGRGRFWLTEVKRVSKVAQELGADVEVNPAAGTIKLILPKKGGTARQKDEKPEDDLVELLK